MSQVPLPVAAISEIETVRRSRSKEADRPTVEVHTASEKIAESSADEFPQVDDMSFAQIAVLLLGLGLSLFLFAIDETIVATSVSTIGFELGIKDSLTWITSSYLLTTTVILPITGRIADAVDIKTFIIVELWVFVIGNIIAGTAHGFAQLVAGRLISGVGGAGLLNLTCIILAKMTTEKQRGAYMNLVNGVFIVSDSLGPVVGGALAHAGQWRWIFLLAAPFGPVITVFIYFTLRTPPPPARVHSFHQLVTTVDLLGMFLVVTFLSLLVIALNMGGQDLPWDDSVIIGCLAGAGVAFVFFILVEKRAEMPIVPVELFTKWKWRNVPIMTLLRILSFFHIFALTFYLPVFLQVIDVPTITASALIIPFLLMASLSSTATSWFMTRCKTGLQLRALFIAPLAVLVTGLSLMATLTERSSIGRIVGYSIICGIGFGSATQITMVIAQLGLPADYLSTTTALVGTAPMLGGTLGVAILGSAINNIYRDTLVTSPYASALTDLNPNSVVETLQHLLEGSEEYNAVVGAYVKAWQMGCWILVGITGLEILLCLGIKAVSFDDKPEEKRSEEHETTV